MYSKIPTDKRAELFSKSGICCYKQQQSVMQIISMVGDIKKALKCLIANLQLQMHMTWPAKTPGVHVNAAVIELQTSLVSQGQIERIRRVHHFFCN